MKIVLGETVLRHGMPCSGAWREHGLEWEAFRPSGVLAYVVVTVATATEAFV